MTSPEEASMSDLTDNSYTEEEIEANSQVDAIAILALVVIAVGMLVHFVAG
jgi:hypothetical protein